MNADELARAVGVEAARELEHALDRIKHCVAQLSDEQVWWRAHPSMNSVGNLLLHLCGNIRQWIIVGLSGGTDARDRPAEFAERGPIARDELMKKLEAVVAEATAVLVRQTAPQLVESRRIQGSDITGLQAIFNSVPHFRGHTQEIIHITRTLLGDAYQVAWAPQTREEGAPQ